MNSQASLFLSILRSPQRFFKCSLEQWDLILRIARRANLLSRLDALLNSDERFKQLPDSVKAHLLSARALAKQQQRIIAWEVQQIDIALRSIGVSTVLLKGAAYSFAGYPLAQGRLFADVDILVPKSQLDRVEHALMHHGWVSSHLNAYDQRYYRTWMHELPPMRHVKRQTVIDVHHNILPSTAPIRPDGAKFLESAVPALAGSSIKVLAPIDMVLHSATHLFHDGEFENGLRDLLDIDGLIRQFSGRETFWPQLLGRAKEQQLERPLYYALKYSSALFETPVPHTVLHQSRQARPSIPVNWFMHQLLKRALLPDHYQCKDALTDACLWVLYVRAHRLRMPFHLLLPHLIRKTFRGEHNQTL